jgi:hypothetical protein
MYARHRVVWADPAQNSSTKWVKGYQGMKKRELREVCMMRGRQRSVDTPLRRLELVQAVRMPPEQAARCRDVSRSQGRVHMKEYERRGGVEWGSD